MTRTVRSVVGAGVVAAAVLAGAVHAHAGQTAATAAGCNQNDVAVVVDFGPSGGGTVVRCVTGPSSGLDALSKAGFSYGFRPGFPGMVCTIGARPNPCNGAPADAYWAYWHAPAGGGWTYATQGAGTRTPLPGSVEGWAFGDDRRPSISAPASATTTTTAKPTTTTAKRPTPPPAPVPAPPAVDGLAPDAPAAPGADPSTTSTTADGAASTTTVAAESDISPTTAPELADEADELAVDPVSTTSTGGSTTTWLGLVLVIALLFAGAWEFRRRRSP